MPSDDAHRRQRRRRRATAASLAALLCAAGAPSAAGAATFTLSDGERIEGAMARLAETLAAIETGDGVRLIPRAAISDVAVTDESGRRLSGRLLDWRAGAYTLEGAEGRARVVDGAPAAPAPADATRATTTARAGAAAGAPSAAAPAAPAAPAAAEAPASPPPQAALRVSVDAPALAAPTVDLSHRAIDRSPDLEDVAAAAQAARQAQAQGSSVQGDGEGQTRGLLTNLIFGDGGAAAPPASDAGGGAQNPAPAVGAAARNAGSAAADPLAAPPSAAAPAPRAPDERPPASSFADLYHRAVLGDAAARTGPPADLAACVALSAVSAPPRAPTAPAGRDADALVIGVTDDVSRRLFADLGAAFFATAGVALAPDDGDGDAEAGETLRRQAGLRPSRPSALRMRPLQSTAAAAQALTEGRIDVAVAAASEPPAGGAQLIGFEAVALAAHADNPLAALSAAQLQALMDGRLSDWSMIEPSFIGAPTLFAPPARSESVRRLLVFAGVRRLKARGVRHLAAPAERLAALAADPRALAVAPVSALTAAGGAAGFRTLAVGGAAGPARPSVDAARTGDYPLVAPVYAAARENGHPAGPVFVDFLMSPAGQRALYEGGFASTASCDPTSCPLSAPGVADARTRVVALSRWAPITEPSAPAGPPTARLPFPRAGEPPQAAVAALSRLAAELGAARAGVSVRAAAAPQGAEATAAARAEAVALALRCAGADARLAPGAPAVGDAVEVTVHLR